MKDRKSRALSIRTIFSRPDVHQHQDTTDNTELISELKEENRRLSAEIEDLKTKNVLPGLIAARDFVEGLDGRTGKRQITEKLSALIRETSGWELESWTTSTASTTRKARNDG